MNTNLHHRYLHAARGVFAVTAAMLLGVAGGTCIAAGPAGRTNSERLQPVSTLDKEASEALAAIVRDFQAAQSARSEAASLLIQRAVAGAQERGLVEQLLADTTGETSPSWVMLGAIARQPSIDDWLLPAVAGVIQRADDKAQARALTSLGGLRMREAVRILVDVSSSARSDTVRRAGWAALTRLSGRADIGENAQGWRAWLDSTESLSREEWSNLIAAGQARRAEAAEAARQSAVARLVEAYRRVHVTLAADQRSDFLAGLLRDETDDVRLLGFELVLRELSENARLGPSVEAAAISILESPSPQMREKAGLLIAQLSPPSARGPVTAALRKEEDPAAASALLRAAARWPDEAMLDTALHWVDASSPALASAVDYIRALVRAGFVQSPQDRERVLGSLRAIPLEKLPPGSCDVLVHMGDDDDINSVARLLTMPSGPVRLAAAQALLLTPEHLDDVLLAAQNDPELFDIAARAVTMYWATADGFRSIASLRAPSQDAWRRGLLRLAEMLPAPDLVEVAATAEPAMREPLLANLASLNRILSERYSTTTFEALGKGLIELAQLRLTLNKPDEALAALDSMQELPALEGEDAVNAIRAESLLCLGRLGEAQSVPCGPGPWLSALAKSIDKPFAPTLADQFKSRFGGGLTSQEQAKFQQLASRLSSVESPGR